ncbi:MAG TPA: MBL fold metallo-hydrolase, partial [Actinomycetota bacterium]|nr:MBL fold metallo-hydrolase [Actinomycetota bacterium]
HVHCFVLRLPERTILFDTGIGPPTAPAFAWTGASGRLWDELEAAGVAREDVELVVISHTHDDHLGWTVDDDGAPAFPGARYLVHRADVEALRGSDDAEDREIWRKTVAPLEAAGVLDANDAPTELDRGLTLIHAPGHTPGHQVLLVDRGERAVLSADVTNHPALVEQPKWHQQTDTDPELASETRAELLERFERERRLYVASHFAEPRGTIVSGRDARRFRPL